MTMIDERRLWPLIEARAEATPDALMVLADEAERTMTFAEYRDAVLRAAAGLAAKGVDHGTNVSWQLPTWIESLVLVGALSRLGAVQNPIIPIYRSREVGFAVKQTGASLLVVPSQWGGFDYEAMARDVAGGAEVLVADKQLPEGDPALLSKYPDAGPEDVRWIFYTSGTTADPKGARHTDATVSAAAAAMSERLELTADDRQALIFPFTHIGGIIWLFSSLSSGCGNIVVEAFNPATTIDLMDQHEMTLAGAGTFFHQTYLVEARNRAPRKLFTKVRAFPGGAAPKPPQLHKDLKAEVGGVGIVSGYGLTECPILSMASVNDPDDKLANTEGRVTPGVDLRLVEGEIRVKAPQLFKGYLDESLNADAFDSDGYFRTGDLGELDDGYVIITGRLKDIIIRKGENISAKELEDLLHTHPKVAEAAVIGLPDPSSGERACAVVVARDAGDPVGFEEMVEFLKGKGITTQKLPEQLELVDVLPRNPTGKILKHELQSRFTS
ncbi:MAG: cyclohexanecarboxylate-CoA ligase [Actinomycetota bacterium]|jgi:acyl-CoA synthetase (AMP-forming)/AMP-acid ligase II